MAGHTGASHANDCQEYSQCLSRKTQSVTARNREEYRTLNASQADLGKEDDPAAEPLDVNCVSNNASRGRKQPSDPTHPPHFSTQWRHRRSVSFVVRTHLMAQCKRQADAPVILRSEVVGSISRLAISNSSVAIHLALSNCEYHRQYMDMAPCETLVVFSVCS